jgi:hypothetical protein
MKTTIEPRYLESGDIEPAHAIEVVCDNCGFDLDESELTADTCSDCGTALKLKQHVAITVTTVPMSGASM